MSKHVIQRGVKPGYDPSVSWEPLESFDVLNFPNLMSALTLVKSSLAVLRLQLYFIDLKQVI